VSPSVRCGLSALRPTFGRVSRYGAMTLSWTRDRLGPFCRTAEDCALVFHAIAKTDEQDLSVIDLPFNWDATLDIRTLRVGYLEPAGVEDGRTEEWKTNDQRTLDQLRSLGVKLEPFTLPKLSLTAVSGPSGAESGAAFDEFIRNGRDKELTNKNRSNGLRQSHLIPAVDYLQSQRVRAMIMRQFAEVVSKFDVYLSSAPNPTLAGEGGRSAGESTTPATPPTPNREHYEVANICCYPAVSIPNGFTSDGRPTSILFLGRLYAEAQILALAKAYQDSTHWHEQHPKLT